MLKRSCRITASTAGIRESCLVLCYAKALKTSEPWLQDYSSADFNPHDLR